MTSHQLLLSEWYVAVIALRSLLSACAYRLIKPVKCDLIQSWNQYFGGLSTIDLHYPISKTTWAALLLMVTEGCVSFSFRMVMASVAKASEASTRRQLESVPRISSWISSDSVFNLSMSKGIKPARRISTAPARGESGEGVNAFIIFTCKFNFLVRLKHVTHFLTHMQD